MIDLTYTIAHIQIGAENYYEEIAGLFISDDKNTLMLVGIAEDYPEIMTFAKNESHPLFEVANKLGAIIYTYERDEEDFYIAMPTAYNIKAGDIFFRSKQKWIAKYNIEFGIGIKVEVEDEGYYKPRNLLHILIKYNGNGGNLYFGHELRKADEDLKNNYDELFQEWILYSIKDNIFKEYARTGTVKSDIYKQHFK